MCQARDGYKKMGDALDASRTILDKLTSKSQTCINLFFIVTGTSINIHELEVAHERTREESAKLIDQLAGTGDFVESEGLQSDKLLEANATLISQLKLADKNAGSLQATLTKLKGKRETVRARASAAVRSVHHL